MRDILKEIKEIAIEMEPSKMETDDVRELIEDLVNDSLTEEELLDILRVMKIGLEVIEKIRDH